MSVIENIRLALSGIRASKMRSFLTMLGIIIGIASVIGIVSIGNSLTNSITSSMEDMGANQIFIYVSNKEANTMNEMTDSDYITDEIIADFRERFDDKILAVSTIEAAGSGQVKSGQRYANVNVSGTNAGYVEANSLEILKGSDIRQRDVDRASYVAVVSDKFVGRMFPPNVDPIGEKIKVHTTNYGVLTFTITGVYTYEVPAFAAAFVPDDDVSTDMIIPVSTAKRISGAPDGYGQISVMFPPEADSYALSNEMTEFLSTYYRSNPHFTIYSQNMAGMLDQFTSMLTTVSIAITIIAGISLLVGGIGVMNIMLVSVTERTREIGTRKALGAKNSDIRIQFIIEAIILCLIGGVLGVILGLVLGTVGATALGFPSSPSIIAIIVAVVFSMFIGVFFGYFPANKAAKLDPIEALRYE